MDLRILMLEDSPEDVEMIQRILKEDGLQFDSYIVDTEQEFIDGLKELKPDIILSDHTLPQFNSKKALKICNDLDYNIPFILVTGAISREIATSMVEQGAVGFILKDDLTTLSFTITQALKQRQLSLEKAELEANLRKCRLNLKKLNEKLTMLANDTTDNQGRLYPPKLRTELMNLTILEISSQHAILNCMYKVRSSMKAFENTLTHTPNNNLDKD